MIVLSEGELKVNLQRDALSNGKKKPLMAFSNS